MSKWSRVQHTNLAISARSIIEGATKHYGLTYHNIDHVESMYDYLFATQEPYSEALDWAVLFHDVVYDSHKDKELRSVELLIDFATRYDGCNVFVGDVANLIEATITHKVTDSKYSAIIRADLHGLSDVSTTIINYGKILTESKNIYEVSSKDFALANVSYMQNLLKTIAYNKEADKEYALFYEAVDRNIRLIMKISELIKEIHC